jgi:hypothetical protein
MMAERTFPTCGVLWVPTLPFRMLIGEKDQSSQTGLWVQVMIQSQHQWLVVA